MTDGRPLAENSVTLRIGADPTDLNKGLRQSNAAISTFGARTKATIARVGGSIKGLADRMVTPFNSLVLGGGLGMAIKNVGDLSESLMYYGFAAKKSDADTKVFRESLHKTAIETGFSANEILNGVSKIGEITGQFDFAEDMAGTLTKAALASGASIEDLANVASSLRVTMGLSADEVSKFFNSLIIQGDQGSFVLRSFAGEGKALLAATSTHGIKTAEQFASFGGYLQVMNSQIKSEAELTTSVSALFSELAAKAKELNKIGVHVVDKNREFNDFDAIIRQLMDKTNGDILKLGKYFGASSMKALMPIITEYKNGWKTLDTITKSGQEGMNNTQVLDERAEKAANNFKNNVRKMKAVAEKFADTNLAGPVDTLNKALGYLSKHQGIVTAGFSAMTIAALALGAVKIGGLVKDTARLAMDLKGLWTKKFGKGPSASDTGASAMSAAVQKVFVVNMRGGFGGGSDYMDDDAPMTRTSPVAAETKNTAREMGRFRTGLNSARAGLNAIGRSPIGMMGLAAATDWAVGKIYDFGAACVELYETNKEMEARNKEIQENGQKVIGEKYGYEAEFWAREWDNAFNAMTKELNSFFYVNEEKVAKLQAEMNKARENMQKAVKENKERREENAKNGAHVMTAQEYMQQLNVTINLDQANNRYTAQSDGGKPAKVKVQNTPGMGR